MGWRELFWQHCSVLYSDRKKVTLVTATHTVILYQSLCCLFCMLQNSPLYEYLKTTCPDEDFLCQSPATWPRDHLRDYDDDVGGAGGRDGRRKKVSESLGNFNSSVIPQ